MCLAGVFKCEAEESPSVTRSPRSSPPPQEPVLQGKLWQKLQNSGWEKNMLKLQRVSPHQQSHIVCTSPRLHLASLSDYLCLSVPFCLSVCPNNFTVHTKWIFFCSISKCLLKRNIKGSTFARLSPCFFVFLGTFYLALCDGEGGSVSEDPAHPYQWLPFIWCNWKCMHFLLRRIEKSRDGKPKVENQLCWNVLLLFGEGKHCACWESELHWRQEWTRLHILGL